MSKFKQRLNDIISFSDRDDIDEELMFLVIDASTFVSQVDLYNSFYEMLESIKNREDISDDVYESISKIMDCIWCGTTGHIQLYDRVMTDKDIEARKLSKRMFKK